MTTIRLSALTYQKLQDLACASGLSEEGVLARALDLYARRQLIFSTNAAYAGLSEDAKAWEHFRKELAEWDATLSDGLGSA